MYYTHRNVPCRNSGGDLLRRAVRVTVEGDRDDPAVRKAIADVLASSGLRPADAPSGPPVAPETAQLSRADIHAMNKAELLAWVKASPELSGIDTGGTVKAMETAVFKRLGI